MPGVSYRMIGYRAGRFVRTAIMVVLLTIAVAASLFMAAISLRLLIFMGQCINTAQWQMGWFAVVGTFVCGSGSYVYGAMVQEVWKELRRPNIHPVVPLARDN